MFPIEPWSVYDRTMMNLPRSNNFIEGWHNAFAERVAVVHPSVTKLAEKIDHEQSKSKWTFRKFGKDKNQNQKLDERIKRLVDDYFNVELVEYLNGLTANMSLSFFCCMELIFFSTKLLFQSFSIN